MFSKFLYMLITVSVVLIFSSCENTTNNFKGMITPEDEQIETFESAISDNSEIAKESIVEPTLQPIVEPIVEPVEEPIIPAVNQDEQQAENNLCKVGDILKVGESCLDGTGDEFTVLENGSGRYLFITAGKGIRLLGNINGKVRNFVAEKQPDNNWKILSVTPEE